MRRGRGRGYGGTGMRGQGERVMGRGRGWRICSISTLGVEGSRCLIRGWGIRGRDSREPPRGWPSKEARHRRKREIRGWGIRGSGRKPRGGWKEARGEMAGAQRTWGIRQNHRNVDAYNGLLRSSRDICQLSFGCWYCGNSRVGWIRRIEWRVVFKLQSSDRQERLQDAIGASGMPRAQDEHPRHHHTLHTGLICPPIYISYFTTSS
jgi:hypothetical protein